MNKLFSIFFLFLVFLFFSNPSEAAKKTLPQAGQTTKSSSASKASSTTGITVWPKLRRDRQAIFITFGNLQNSSSISYTLIYKTNGQEEGAGGSVNPTGQNSASRELLFGTCSKNVCRYHKNISNMRLEITGDLKSGKKFLKRYKIKI